MVYKTEVGNETAEIPWLSCYLLQSSCSLLIIILGPVTVKKKLSEETKKNIL